MSKNFWAREVQVRARMDSETEWKLAKTEVSDVLDALLEGLSASEVKEFCDELKRGVRRIDLND